MAKILFAWELGGGIGHLMTLRPLVQRMSEAGHQVTLVLRQLAHAAKVFHSVEANFLQAPVKIGRAPSNIASPATFAHLLWNTGFSDIVELRALVESWRIILGYVQPDLIVFDHSPLSVLASSGLAAKRIIVGHGFFCPAAVDQMPDWRPEERNDPEKLRRDERMVLDNANDVLASMGQSRLARLSDLFSNVDEILLTTFRELDAVAERPNAEYWGEWRTPFGKAPRWPEIAGQRVFAYLKPSPALPLVLTELIRRKLPTIVYAGGLDERLVEHFRAPNMVFETEPVDLDAVARQCDLTILNANHGTVLQMLLAGAPLLMLPLFLEQRITGERTVALGAGLMLNSPTGDGLPQALEHLLSDPCFRRNARAFADRYAGFDSLETLGHVSAKLLAMLEGC